MEERVGAAQLCLFKSLTVYGLLGFSAVQQVEYDGFS